MKLTLRDVLEALVPIALAVMAGVVIGWVAHDHAQAAEPAAVWVTPEPTLPAPIPGLPA